MAEFLDNLGNQTALYAPRILWTVLLAVAFYLASWLLAAAIRRLGAR